MKAKPESDFRIKLVTRDGQLVQNREARMENWFMNWSRNPNPNVERGWSFNKDFAQLSLQRDCAEKGCKLISYTYDFKTGVTAIVSWFL